MANSTKLFGRDLESLTSFGDGRNCTSDGALSTAIEPLEFPEPVRWRRRARFTDLVALISRRVQNNYFRTKLRRRIWFLIVGYLSLV
jgi:hypothetical protein